jgi:hypothetical protein
VDRRTPEPPARADASFSRHRYQKLLVGSVVVVACFGWLLNAGALPVIPPARAFADVHWWWVAGFGLLFALSSLIRAAKWWWLLVPIRELPMRRVVIVGLAGYAALFILPFRSGEFVRPALIRKHGVSGWSAMGSVAAERIVDGLTVTLLLLLGLALAEPLDPLPSTIGDLPISAALVPTLSYVAVALFVVAFAIMALVYFARDVARRAVERVIGLISKRAAAWSAGRVEQLAEGLGFLPRWRFSIPFVALTFLYWLVFAAANWVLLRGSGLGAVGFDQACVVIGVFSIAILLPNAPGFFGAFQLSLYAALAMYFPPEILVGPGAAFVFINYVGQVALTLLLGVCGVLVDRLRVDH